MDWHIRSVDFVLAFPQAKIKTDIYTRSPKVPSNLSIPDLPSFTVRFINVYKLLQNVYGLKDTGKTWNDFLNKVLVDKGWKYSYIDPLLYIKCNILLTLYVDDTCFISPTNEAITREI